MRWAFAAVLLCGCGEAAVPASAPEHPSPPAPTRTQAEPAKLTPAEIAARSADSIVVVTTGSSLGAGFVVGRNRVATCFHVVQGATAITVRTRNGSERNVASVIAYDEVGDVALLYVEELHLSSLPLGDSAEVESGDPVTVVGHPRGLEDTVSTGVVSGTRHLSDGLRLFQITAPISPGSSGGPVMNEYGQVIGISRSVLPDGQALNFATPISGVKQLLRAPKVPIPVAQFAALTGEKTAERAKARAAAAQPTTQGPVFPSSVAGFSFGMPLEAVAKACPELHYGQGHAICPYPVIRLPFGVKSVWMTFSKDVVTAIFLEGVSREEVEPALVRK